MVATSVAGMWPRYNCQRHIDYSCSRSESLSLFWRQIVLVLRHQVIYSCRFARTDRWHVTKSAYNSAFWARVCVCGLVAWPAARTCRRCACAVVPASTRHWLRRLTNGGGCSGKERRRSLMRCQLVARRRRLPEYDTSDPVRHCVLSLIWYVNHLKARDINWLHFAIQV